MAKRCKKCKVPLEGFMYNKSIILVLIAICLLVSSTSFSQDAILGETSLIKKIETAKTITAYLTSIFYWKDEANRIHEDRSYGTGFFVDTTTFKGLRVITNRHVVLFKTPHGQAIAADKVLIKVNSPDVNERVYWEGKIANLNDIYDIAILDLVKQYNVVNGIPIRKTEKDQYYAVLANGVLIVEQDFLEDGDIKEGKDVYFIGYPLRLGGEEYKNFPVVRKGIVAQVIPGTKIFLMDGLVSLGNSGSPVVSLINEKPKLLGIVQGAYTERYPYEESSFNSGLAIVINSSVIKDFIYESRDKRLLIHTIWEEKP